MNNYVVILLLIGPIAIAAKCQGKFLNPITDLCWSCIFPITIGGVNLSASQEDTPNPNSIACVCPRPPGVPVPGIPVSFWEPVRLVDVTRTPYCMVNLGLSLANSKLKGAGSNSITGGGQNSFNVPWGQVNPDRKVPRRDGNRHVRHCLE